LISPGDVVEYRHVRLGRSWWVNPARVVAADATEVVLWWPAGTTYLRPRSFDRQEVLALIASGSWQLGEVEWWGGDSLLVIPRNAPFAIWPYRNHEGDLIGWYCNLQAPLIETARGFDTCDWTLDVVASPDLSGWMLKDEDELEDGRRLGLYDDADVERIREAADAVIELIERRDPIFERWRDWRPLPGWDPPVLPVD
jgi:hypothetical protein